MAAKMVAAILLAALSYASAQEKAAPTAQTIAELCNDSDVAAGIDPPDSFLSSWIFGAEMATTAKPPCPFQVGSNERPFHYLPAGATIPRLLTYAEPLYTGQAFIPGLETVVDLYVMVSTEGSPLQVSEENGSFTTEINNKAIEVAKTWKWQPASENGRPIAAPARIRVRFRLQGTSAKPHIFEPPAAAIPLRPSFDPVKYPLTVYPMGTGAGLLPMNSEIGGYRVQVDAAFDRSTRDATHRLSCTGKNRNCSIPRGFEFPARWLIDHQSLELLGKTADGEWRTVEYECEIKTETPPSGWWPITIPWSIFY